MEVFSACVSFEDKGICMTEFVFPCGGRGGGGGGADDDEAA